MSLVPGFAPDAMSQWKGLEFELQERVLDEVEAIALSRPRVGEHIIDFVHLDANGMHYVFLRIYVDANVNRLSVIGVGYVRQELTP